MTPVRIDGGTTPLELAGIVATLLRVADIEAVLSGGAAVAAYTNDRYLTRDIDFVASIGSDESERAPGSSGFVRPRRRRHFEHPDSDLLVEFPPGPPAVGNRLLRRDRPDPHSTRRVGRARAEARPVSGRARTDRPGETGR